MREFDALAASLRGEAMQEAAAALLAALRGEGGAVSLGGEAAAPEVSAEGNAGRGGTEWERPALRRGAAAEQAAVPAEAAAEGPEGETARPTAAALFGERSASLRRPAESGEAGRAVQAHGLWSAAAAERAERLDAETLSEAVRRDSRRYDRSFR